MVIRKQINRLLVGGLICLWVSWHLVINSVELSYQYGDGGYVWLCGFLIHGSILIDIILWSGLVLLFILLVIIE